MATRGNDDVTKSMNQMNSGNNSAVISHDDGGDGFNQEMRPIQKSKSKLNPMAPEFVPTYVAAAVDSATENTNGSRRRRPRARPRPRRKFNPCEAEIEQVRRTVFVSSIDNRISEEHLAALFLSCGPLVDCRICGDPTSMLRFGFVEFAEEESARISLSLERTMLGAHAIRVVPSRSAIAPVDRRLLPRSAAERERCTRTIYCTNIQREVPAEEIIFFFESFCGKVLRLRVFDNRHYPTCAAFVEFAMSESAVAALNCSGFVLGALPIRVNPSKTPILLGDFHSRI